MARIQHNIKSSIGILKATGNLRKEIKEMKKEEKRLENRKLLLCKKNRKES
jgi:hypothetical protein